MVLSALFFGALASGSAYMQLQTDVPDSIAVIVQAVVILFIGIRVLRRPSRPGANPSDATGEEAKHVPF